MNRIQSLLTAGLLACPDSKEVLGIGVHDLVSPSGQHFPIQANGKPNFLGPVAEPSQKKTKMDWIDVCKSKLKHVLGGLYPYFVYVVAPVMPRWHWQTCQTYSNYLFSKYFQPNERVIQVGSGNSRLGKNVINLDVRDFPEVDVIADATRLPFADGSLDGVATIAVLEHLPDAEAALREFTRVIKPGGIVYTAVPFLSPFHASPHDYCRWTREGLDSLCRRNGLEVICSEAIAGPTSALLWNFQEWASLILSVGSTKLYYFWFVILTVALFPLKLLDTILIYHPEAYRSACAFACIARKRATD